MPVTGENVTIGELPGCPMRPIVSRMLTLSPSRPLPPPPDLVARVPGRAPASARPMLYDAFDYQTDLAEQVRGVVELRAKHARSIPESLFLVSIDTLTLPPAAAAGDRKVTLVGKARNLK